MITLDLLNANEALKGLDDAVKQSIVTLSKNDEVTVIAKKTGEIAQRIEDDFTAATGIEKKPGEKYYDLIKRGGLELKTSAEGAGKAAELQTEIDRLKTELKGKADPKAQERITALEKDLADEKNRVTELQTQMTTAKTEYDQNLSNERNALLQYEYRNEFRKALAGKEKRAGLSDDDFEELLTLRMQQALGDNQLAFEDLSDGNRALRLKDKNGHTVNNPNDLGNPMTIGTLALDKAGDLLNAKREQGGGGGAPPAGGGGGGAAFRVTAKSKPDATRQIEKHLASQGIATNNPEYQKQLTELYTANEVGKLPLRAE